MSKALIPTFTGTINNQAQTIVNARDLHVFLNIGQKFTDWIKNAIAEYGFVQDEEFFIVSGKTSGFFGGRPKTEYHISLDMAKELAMVQRSDKGRQARRYFIACEKALTNSAAQPTHTVQLQQELLKARPMWSDILRYKQIGLKTTEISKLINRAPSTVNGYIRHMQSLGFSVSSEPQPKQLSLAMEV